ncbi:hypothetical protein HBH70_185340 [Parastagonospora nodorum]|nr:hypothetical protein HBH61_219380 [Parastagonospora nodorum]KAH5130951.1 hypothetical protein HBH70_185340 [Parastagonospora nodorum]KAH5481285.1 hypothetical protein HBI31_185030 [Parastagonospora nodorum]KAH6046353.1 hypothetical protein HBI54_081700 [Parastagonospora nodorum]
MAGAVPYSKDRINHTPRYIPNYPGIQSNNSTSSITVFSDLRFGDSRSEYKDPKTTAVMNFVLDDECSDLVVLDGDLISCENVAPDKFNGIIDQVVPPLVSRNQPFALTFGNHDCSETWSTRSMALHMWWDIKGNKGEKHPFTTQSVEGPVEQVGWSNYYIPVYSSADGDKLEMLLWFFDSKVGKVFQPGANLDTPVGSCVDQR